MDGSFLVLIDAIVFAPKVNNWLLMTTQEKNYCADRYGPHISCMRVLIYDVFYE